MGYLDLISHLDTMDAENASAYDQNDPNDKTPDTRPPCEHPLYLAESKAIGRCIRCQSEAEFVDTLARLRLGRELRAHAVTVRAEQLRMDGRP
jgi:hypothetical protein